MSSPKDFNSRWTWLLDRYGLPVVILALIGTSAYQTTRWAAPLCEKVVSKHVEFLDKTTKVQVELSRSAEKTASILDELLGENRGNADMIRDIHGVVVRGQKPLGAAGVAAQAADDAPEDQLEN